MDFQVLASEGLEFIRNILGAILALFENGLGRVSRTVRESRRSSRRRAKMQLSSFLEEDMVQSCVVRRCSSCVVSSAFTCVFEEYEAIDVK